MKKNRFIALALAAGMTFCNVATTGVVAYAETQTTTTHKINAPANTTHIYEIYQIFTGNAYTSEENGQKGLNNVTYGSNTKGRTIGDAVSQADMETLTALADAARTNDQDDIENIAPFVNLTSPIATIGKDLESSATVEEGYYLIKDKDGSLNNTEEVYTLYLMSVLDSDLTITPKSDKPSSDKKIKDTNDSTGDTTEWQATSDYDIGDKVPYQLTATLPSNYTDFKTYHLTFHDKMDSGLTFNKDSVKVYLDNSETALASTNYNIVTATTDNDTFDIVFTYANLTTIGVTNSSVIRVEYDATLNENAVIGNPGNLNKSWITYDNNPNSDQDGEEGGKTPENTVVTFTYRIDVDKIDADYNSLTGAGFTLYKEYASLPEGVTAKEKSTAVEGEFFTENNKYYKVVNVWTNTDGTLTSFTFDGIDDGTYILSETKVPTGYNKADDVTIVVSAEHETEITSLTADGGNFQANANGGTFTFVKDSDNTKTHEYTSDKAAVAGAIVNQSGTVLPSTGGMGTTILYVIGGILVIGGGAAIFIKRKKDAE
ncbi:LPXTG-motif cell wall anchor domain-containing protein/fimbrial isopeptide formation D2 domain-containing protein [Oribacterium sp. KHPX15]|uniref:SpaH/EbpB family LPXTG-anchored major pilin n=1 Tax=Oribacterium sp. KHPX15 TaxID=1855342 RepID=UPI0008995DB4|nr:SpaH/EbpB family LPXTG-anchored major pilin [Oribacterium sp. KHPX15]SEA22753.1 LPXTG-motif cell wall anchor domain-containing protein/fimbrial isopeptide formation D2 domain-containing protein [Oribacterium sp. KHPX15]